MKTLEIYLLGCLVSLLIIGISLITKRNKFWAIKKYILAYIIYILFSWIGVISSIVMRIVALWKKQKSRQ